MSRSMHDYVVEALQDADLSATEAETGISRWTLQKIRLRQIKNPGVKGIETLYQHFKLIEAKSSRMRARRVAA